jgi:hypothetical protein
VVWLPERVEHRASEESAMQAAKFQRESAAKAIV